LSQLALLSPGLSTRLDPRRDPRRRDGLPAEDRCGELATEQSLNNLLPNTS
jgi:hypothetical protein